jgi:hypothetical protein
MAFRRILWGLLWSQHTGSNRGPADYKSVLKMYFKGIFEYWLLYGCAIRDFLV